MDHSAQIQILTDAVARRLVARSISNREAVDADDLGEFASYLAGELWDTLPPAIQAASYDTRAELPSADEIDLETLSSEYSDTLVTYELVLDTDGAEAFTRKALEDYLTDATAQPPAWSSTRTDECELCGREVPLTYHHLIPRSTHAKVLKKGWHLERMLNSVAWLCRYVPTPTSDH
jgi:hypothetical protein